MCIHSMCSTKFSYCFLLQSTPIGRPEHTRIPSRNFQVSSLVLMLSQPVRSRSLNRSTNGGSGDCAPRPPHTVRIATTTATGFRDILATSPVHPPPNQCETISVESGVRSVFQHFRHVEIQDLTPSCYDPQQRNAARPSWSRASPSPRIQARGALDAGLRGARERGP